MKQTADGQHRHIEVLVDVPTAKPAAERRIAGVVQILERLDAKRVAQLAITVSRRLDPKLQRQLDAVRARFD